MTISTYGDISQRTAAYAMLDMLEYAKGHNVLAMFGALKPIPANKAQTVKFRRVIPLAALTAPLVEGVTPTPEGLRYEDVTVSLSQWGNVLALTDVIQDLSEDPVLKDMTQQAGEQAGKTFEQIIYGVLKGGTSVFYTNGVTRAAVNTPISLPKQRAVTRFLKRMKAMKFTKVLSPSPNIGTLPVEASFIAVAHTDLESDIRNMAGFIPEASYGSRTKICDHEIGAVEDVRYVLSADLQAIDNAGGAPGAMESTGGIAANIYPIFYFGMDAFAVTPLKNQTVNSKSNMPITPTVINPGTIDKSDPLGQRGYVTWKAYFATVRLNETWMARLEAAVTKLA